jgi:PAS domain S-box-containing protein
MSSANRPSKDRRSSVGQPSGGVSRDKAPKPKPSADKGRFAVQPSEHKLFPIVGMGASAGGLEAFKRFLGAMPGDSGMAFVLIQHLDPHHESLMVDLLDRCTAMKVVQVEDRMPVEPNQVYMIPPNKYLAIEKGVLQLTDPIKRRGMRMPIDFLFRSLAEDQQERAICIVLSGTGTDGTLGLQAIKGHGGMTMVQTPETAQYDGMPRSAISTGLVDYVLNVEAMPEALMKYVRHPYINHGHQRQDLAEQSADHLQAVLGMLRARTRYDFRGYKKGTLMRRIERRMGLNHIDELSEYVPFLQKYPAEVRQLFKDLLIGVTGFFREPEAFQVLETQVVPTLIQGKDFDASLRVWVPGCATGEEPYSIAMLLLEQIQAAQKGSNLHIFASDIDEEALEIARAGIYPESIGADVSPERLRRFFAKEGETYQVSKQVRECVVFAVQNLISDPPFSKLDLISCRNLLIYLEPDVQQKLISLFHFALKEGGYLFLGNSETIGQHEDLFRPISKKWRIYQRIGPTRRDKVNFPIVHEDNAQSTTGPLPITQHRPSSLGELVQQRLVEEYAPASVLVNQRYEILYFFGPTHRYLALPNGEATLNVINMTKEGLRTKVRAAIYKAMREDTRVILTGAQVRWEGAHHIVRVSARPLHTPKALEGLFLLTFEQEAAPILITGRVDEGSDPEASIVHQLETELKTTREELQSTIEELETSNEELKTSNEEVMSMNEELQSTNEELETSKEELQSLNEELSTVNNELQDKIAELEGTNNDLANLFSSTDIATIFLDNSFRITRFTPASGRLFKLILSDIGRPFSDIAHSFDARELLQDAQQVLRTLSPVEKEVHTAEGQWYIKRVRPYRTQDDKIAGVVMTFTEVTDLKRVETELRTLNETLEQRVAQQTGQVKLLRDVAIIANQSDAVEHAFEAALDRVCQYLGWPVGHVYRLADEAQERFVDTGFWALHPPEGFNKLVKATRARSFRRGEGAVGRVVDTGQPEWIDDVTTHASCLRTQDTHDLGIRSCLLFPVLVGRRVVAVLEFFSSQALAPDDGLLDVLGQVGTQLGRVVERARAIESVKENENKTRMLLETAAEGIVTIDQHGIVDAMNPSAERMFGFTASEVIGHNVRMLMPSPYREEHDRYIAHYLSTGHAKVIGIGREVSGQRKDGTIFPIEIAISEFTAGRQRFFAGVMRNVTERKAAEEALRQSEERFRNLAEGSIQGIYSHRDWRPLFINQAYARILGYDTPDEVIALGSLEQCIAPEDRARLKSHHEALLRGEVIPTPYEYEAVRKDGSPVVLQSVMRLIQWEGHGAIQCTVIDITQRKRAEERAKRREAEIARMARLSTLGEMASALAHELNQPLTAIVSYAEGAARRFRSANEADQGLVDVLDHTSALAKRAAEIVRSIRSYVKRPDTRWERIDINKVVSEALHLTNAEAGWKGTTVSVELAPYLPEVEGNFVQMEQVVLNLIRNAVDAMEETELGPRTLIVRTLMNADHEIELTVQDSGQGVAPDMAKQMYEPFVTSKPEGLGMGLTICRTIVEAHGGRLWSSPNADHGATFHVRLPVEQRAVPKETAPSSRP